MKRKEGRSSLKLTEEEKKSEKKTGMFGFPTC